MLLTIIHCRLSSSAKYYNSRHRCQRRCRLDRRSTTNTRVVGGDLNAHR